MISPAQCRMARAALNWTASDLGLRSKVGTATILRFERELSSPVHSTREVLRRAFEAAGLEFIADTGVNIRKPQNGKRRGPRTRTGVTEP